MKRPAYPSDSATENGLLVPSSPIAPPPKPGGRPIHQSPRRWRDRQRVMALCCAWQTLRGCYPDDLATPWRIVFSTATVPWRNVMAPGNGYMASTRRAAPCSGSARPLVRAIIDSQPSSDPESVDHCGEGGPEATTPARRSRAASATSWWIPWGCRWRWQCTPADSPARDGPVPPAADRRWAVSLDYS